MGIQPSSGLPDKAALVGTLWENGTADASFCQMLDHAIDKGHDFFVVKRAHYRPDGSFSHWRKDCYLAAL